MKSLEFYINKEKMLQSKRKVSTGYRVLDNFFEGEGVGEGDLVVIGGRPAMGKTGFALNLSLNIFKKYGKEILYFSLNESADDLASKILSIESNIPLSQLCRGNKMDKESLEKVIKSIDEMKRMKINFKDTDDLTIEEIQSTCEKYNGSDLGAIIIDDIQSINKSEIDSLDKSYEKILKTLKRVSIKLKCPILILSQLNRRIERQHNRRPQLVNIKGSGEIEYKADIVMLIYRDDYYHSETNEPDIAEIIIAKNRKGDVGECKLSYKRKTFKVSNLGSN
jgi:replicative DNA helicase